MLHDWPFDPLVWIQEILIKLTGLSITVMNKAGHLLMVGDDID